MAASEPGRGEWQPHPSSYSVYESQAPFYHPHHRQENPSYRAPPDGRSPYRGEPPSPYNPQMQRGGHQPPSFPREYWYNEGGPPRGGVGPPPGWEPPGERPSHYEHGSNRGPPQSQPMPHNMRGPPMPPPRSGHYLGVGGRDPNTPMFMSPSRAPLGMQQQQGQGHYTPHPPLQPRRDYASGPEATWMPPPPKSADKQEAKKEKEAKESAASSKSSSSDPKKQEGDPLSLLAKVSSTMEGTKNQKKVQEKEAAGSKAPAPTSPLQRRPHAKPIITPQGSAGGPPPPPYQQPLPQQQSGAKPITPTSGGYYPHAYYEQQQDYYPHGPHPHYPGMPPQYTRGGYPLPQQQQPYYHPQHRRVGSADWDPPPAVVERGSGSFDTGSEGSQQEYHRRYYDYRGPPPEGDYGPPPPPTHQQWQQCRSYPPPRWSYHQAPPPPPQYANRPPPAFMPPRDIIDQRGQPNPKQQQSSGTVAFSPYSYVQQPHLEDKTVLRKKFSWKHFPEVRYFVVVGVLVDFR